MQESFHIAHHVWHMAIVRRYERHILKAYADPVLAFSELSRSLVLPADASHQDFVRLTQQPVGQR